MKILVTGGAGYIGSHACVELLNAGHKVIVVDNLSNSKREALRRVEEITGKDLKFYKIDLLDRGALENVFKKESIDSVIHFAGLKAVGESVAVPLRYYHNNITGTLILCEMMAKYGVKNLVFSSSATVYGDPSSVPITEDFPLSATNPYGQTKLMIEQILRDLYVADSSFNIAILRYFNPVGAHSSGRIGEDPNGIPNNLVPFITQVASGKLDELKVFGDDYDTHDGTGVRDYIHVVDLALGHLKALEKLNTNPGVVTYNLGTGQGYSVLDMVKSFEKTVGKPIPYKIVSRRAGDIAECFADPKKAQEELGWTAVKDIEAMAEDSWRWQSNNPNGYVEPALVILAAGMGNRYGGLKQIDPVGASGETILEYSIYDAIKAGFSKVVFIIKKEMEDAFRDAIWAKIQDKVEVDYVFQDIDDLPEGYVKPEDRVKPWGTAHAVLSCRNSVDTPFAVINADDFYGRASFETLYDYLVEPKDEDQNRYAMVGFTLGNTLTEHGHVARGRCSVNSEGYLEGVEELTKIQRFDNVAKYMDGDGNWVDISEDTIVSMNMWGFTPQILKQLEEGFPVFLEDNKDDILNAEYYLSNLVGLLVDNNEATVKVLPSKEHWYGVTYKADKPVVEEGIKKMTEQGKYPSNLWED